MYYYIKQIGRKSTLHFYIIWKMVFKIMFSYTISCLSVTYMNIETIVQLKTFFKILLFPYVNNHKNIYRSFVSLRNVFTAVVYRSYTMGLPCYCRQIIIILVQGSF